MAERKPRVDDAGVTKLLDRGADEIQRGDSQTILEPGKRLKFQNMCAMISATQSRGTRIPTEGRRF